MENMIRLNLQLFGEKTESATSKKKSDARKKGQVAMSKDMVVAFGLLMTFLVINGTGAMSVEAMKKFYLMIMNVMESGDGAFTGESLSLLYMESILTILRISLPMLLTAMTIGVVASIAQVGFLFTTEPIIPKLDKINPLKGLKKLFSMQSLVELVKSLLKGSLVLLIVWNYFDSNKESLVNSMNLDVKSGVIFIWNTTFSIVVRICILLIILAIVDFAYKKWQHGKDLRMSKQEIKEEYKQMEGDPQLKAKIRDKQRQMAMGRMMQEVPKADVIITNPTHFAIALRYNVSEEAAPKVLAKGQDLIAQKIKSIAGENEIPIVENKPLARTLYKEVDIGRTIPGELFEAVAEVLAYVYGLKKAK
jgi:flagellar biosynthesis protein FlhB